MSRESDLRNRGSQPEQPSFGGCAYCERKRVLWFTGRRWICRECFREHLGGEPTDD